MFEYELPDVGEGVAEGEIVAWHVEPGDSVKEDEVLAEVETDKAVVDLPSPVAGVIETLHAEEGEVVPVGSVVVTIDTGDAGEGAGDETVADDDEAGEETAEPDSATESDGQEASDSGATGASGRVFAPPNVRRLARELGVDIAGVEGSGPGGRVTEGDVRAAAETGGEGDDSGTDEDAETAADTSGDAESDTSQSRKSAVRRRTDDTADATEATADTPQEPAERDRTLAAPATRRLASELGVDIDRVPTDTTRDGEAFVEPDDVRAYAEGRGASEEVSEASGKRGERDERTERADAASDTDKPVTREPYRGIRQTIGEQMEQSAYTAPHVTHHDTAVVSELVEMREQLKPRAAEQGVSLTYLPFVMKAVVATLEEFPVLNTELDEASEEIIYKHHYDIGVAVATDAGLVVPVVERVDEKGLTELAAEVTDLAERARSRDLAPSEMRGSTFTITNFGAIGGEYATPIINYPETAILGLGSIEPRPVVEQDGADDGNGSADPASDAEVVARQTLPLSLSIDHRVIDGAEAARFCNALIERLETPSLLLL